MYRGRSMEEREGDEVEFSSFDKTDDPHPLIYFHGKPRSAFWYSQFTT